MLDIDLIIENLEEKTGHKNIFFDDSRMWTLGYRDESGCVYGVQRGYLGGGVRGAIKSNIEDEDERALFTQALKDIESAINEETQGLESWEQNTGVLLD